ncbi:MAG: GNAT family N-acetyltransferase [Gammaproteobacteria bacterium]|nr:GNAT family N-acetyltransferase [Gammaproteobacteria bacterium]
MKIREAEERDQREWAQMRAQLWPGALEDHLVEIGEFFSGQSIDIEKAYVLQDEAGSLAGFIELNVRDFAEGSRSSPVPYVEGWFVQVGYRGRGLGKQLMQKAEVWAIDQGFSELASDTDLSNELGITIHKTLGFVETKRVVCFLKRLD